MSKNSCPICGGFGFVHPLLKSGATDYFHLIPCECQVEALKEKHRQFLIKTCEFPPFADNPLMSFESFKRKPQTEVGYKACKDMASHPGIAKWLTLLGPNGVGKTHLAISVCREWLKAGIPARYIMVSILLDEFRAGYQSNNTESSYQAKFDYYCAMPLLLLDDYGVESATPWVQEKMDALIDTRLMKNKSTIITSNTPLEDMPPRIRSRLNRHPNSVVVFVGGEDYNLRAK